MISRQAQTCRRVVCRRVVRRRVVRLSCRALVARKEARSQPSPPIPIPSRRRSTAEQSDDTVPKRRIRVPKPSLTQGAAPAAARLHGRSAGRVVRQRDAARCARRSVAPRPQRGADPEGGGGSWGWSPPPGGRWGASIGMVWVTDGPLSWGRLGD